MSYLRSDLPVAEDTSSRFLPALVAIMVFFAAIALAGSLALDGMLDRWGMSMTGTLTVQVPAGDAAEETAARLERAVRLLNSHPDVQSADALADEHLNALLVPWLGSADLVDELPVPRLIDVQLKSGTTPDLDDLLRRLSDVAPGALVDDHRVWLARLVHLAEGLRILAWAVLGMVTVTTMTTVVYATRTALAVHRPQIEVLHLIGATDSYIARQFARRSMVQAVVGGLFGLVLAVPSLMIIGHLMGRLEGGFIPDEGLQPWQWGTLALLPLAAGTLATLTARRTVRRTLARML
jgi:cell division transport system permease protein